MGPTVHHFHAVQHQRRRTSIVFEHALLQEVELYNLQFHDGNYPGGWIFPVSPSLSFFFLSRLSTCNPLQQSSAANKPQEVVAENLRSATSGLIARIPIRISFYCCPCLLNSFEASLCFRNSCNSKLLTHHTHGPPNFANQEAGVSGTANLSSHFLGRGSSSQHWQVLLPLPHQVSNQLSVSGDCGGARMPSAFFTT